MMMNWRRLELHVLSVKTQRSNLCSHQLSTSLLISTVFCYMFRPIKAILELLSCFLYRYMLVLSRVGGTRDEMTGSSSDDWIY
jgi:hypothetical protein